MTVKEHLARHHAKSAAFDIAAGVELDKLRKCFETLETNVDGDDALKKIYGDAKDSVARLAAAFSNHAQYHRDMGATVAKADGIDDLDKLAPSNISGVVDPSKVPSGSRLIPRSGQREVSGTMPTVAEGFEHLVKVDG